MQSAKRSAPAIRLLDIAADWIDYEAAGRRRPAGPRPTRLIETLQLVDLEDDVYQLGLRGTIDPTVRPDLADATC